MNINININITIPNEIKVLHNAFTNAGFVCLGVGGCVRDSIINKHPKDWDVCTNAIPSEVSRIVKTMKGWNILPIGEAFNIMAAISPLGEQYEIATFRTDGNSSDGRRPDSVETATVEEDAKRRDLTINSLYLNLETKEVLDPSNSGGLEDLKKGIIKMVGNPIDRFNEDRLRKLRVVRFALRFNFVIDSKTFFAIRNNPSLEGVSKERIAEEFRKMKAETTAEVIEICEKLGLIEQIFGQSINSEVKFSNTKNLWSKIIAIWCISNKVHPKNIFSNLNVTVDEKRLVEFLFNSANLNFKDFKAIVFKKQFELLKNNLDFSIDELLEFLNDDISSNIISLINSEFVKSSDFTETGPNLGLAMELAQFKRLGL